MSAKGSQQKCRQIPTEAQPQKRRKHRNQKENKNKANAEYRMKVWKRSEYSAGGFNSKKQQQKNEQQQQQQQQRRQRHRQSHPRYICAADSLVCVHVCVCVCTVTAQRTSPQRIAFLTAFLVFSTFIQTPTQRANSVPRFSTQQSRCAALLNN